MGDVFERFGAVGLLIKQMVLLQHIAKRRLGGHCYNSSRWNSNIFLIGCTCLYGSTPQPQTWTWARAKFAISVAEP